jgi:manganese efflux pump family protein
MGVVALITWLSAAGGGLYLLAVWLIEYDREFQAAAKTRLPIPVISAHVLLAMTGLVVWSAYLFTDRPLLAWAALAILGGVVTLGLTMAVRWLRVVREPAAQPPARAAGLSTVAAAGVGLVPAPRPAEAGPGPDPRDVWNPERDWRSPAPDTGVAPSAARARRNAAQAASVPPERNFPVPVVILHGVLAIATVTLVAITAVRGG